MWLKKLKYKKIQFFLVGIMLVAIATVFCTCVCFTLELRTYANDRFSPNYCPDAYVYALNNTKLRDNFPNSSVNKNIKSISMLKGKNITVSMRHKNVNISSITNMLCTFKGSAFWKYMQIDKGNVSSGEPNKGEIWISKTLASSYDIKIGDTITINYEKPVKFIVSAIYMSTFTPSERLTIMPSIVNSEDLHKFDDEPDAAVMALNLYDRSEKSIDKLAMTNPYSLMTFSRKKLKDYVTNISGIVGCISAIAALVVFIAALSIMRFIITNDLKKEIRYIGIYKSLGYSNEKIIDIYIKGYLLVGVIAIAVGTAISLPLVYYLGMSMSKTLGDFRITSTTIVVCIMTIILLVFLIWNATRRSLRQIKNITPVEAVSVGQLLGEHRIMNSVIKNAKSPFSMAINDIFKHKRISIITSVVLTVSIYLILFFASSYYTCENIYKNANVWVACPKFNAIVTGHMNKDVAEVVRKSGYAKSVTCGNFFYYPSVNIPQYKGNARAVEFVVLDDARMKTTGIPIRQGYSPIRPEEIAVSKKLLKEIGMNVGDYLKIGVGNNEKQFFISGSFTSMEEKGIIMTVDGMKLINSSYNPGNCFVVLKKQSDFKEFKDYVESTCSGVSVDKEWTALKSAILAIENMLKSVMKVMLIVFIIFSVISIINVLVMTMSSKRRQYGILKALGFSTSYIIIQNIFHILILFCIATVFAIILHLIFSRKIFEILVIDALINSVTLSSALIFSTALLMVLVALIFNMQVSKIMPANLMEE